jgi:DNA-binding transcriptional MerR regulator
MTSAELTIAEVAERTGLTRHTLRYYERDGLMLDVGRAGSGHRRYSEHDLGWIELITKLRATGMPIREVRRYAELVRAGSGHRRYSEHDLGWIELITKLRATGMPIREVRRYAELVRAGDGNETDRLALLRAHRERVRAQLDTMAAYLDAIDLKIGHYARAQEECESPDSYLSAPHQAAAAARH